MLLQEWRAVLSTVCLVLAYGKFAWPWSGLRVTLFPPDAEWVADDPSAWRLALVMCCALPLFAVFRYLQRLASTKKPEHRFGQRKKFRVSAAVAVACMLLCNSLCFADSKMHLFERQPKTLHVFVTNYRNTDWLVANLNALCTRSKLRSSVRYTVVSMEGN